MDNLLFSVRSESYALCTGLFLVFLSFAAGCSSSQTANDSRQQVHIITPVNGTPIAFNESDSGRIYAIPLDTEFSVKLKETFAAGYRWKITLSPGLELLDSQYVVNPNAPRVDIDGTRIWQLRVTGSGQQTFHADFVSFDDTPDRNIATYNLELRILTKTG